MFIKDWKKEIFTIPNGLSLFRLLLIPVYVRVYLQASTDRQYGLAAGIMAISCVTDLVDGKIARQFNMISHVGKILDPLADKLTQLALILCLSARYPILYPVLVLFVVKELFQLFVCIYNLRRGKALEGALPAGKVCTTVLFISLITLVLLPHLPQVWVDGLVAADAFFLTISFASYIRAYSGGSTKLQDLEG